MILFLYLGITVLLQVRSHAYTNEFGGHPDEAAHYVNGLMVRDFLLNDSWRDPMGFAEGYYVRYPKVSIGHWPPLFYLMQACWTLAIEPTRAALLALMAVLTSLLAWSLYRVARVECGEGGAFALGLLLISLPITREMTSMVMTEMPVALLVFWAALSYGRYTERARWRDASLFGLLASLAIMTKGTGLLLALVPPLTITLARRFGLLTLPSFYWPALIVLMTCGPWQYATMEMVRNGWMLDSPSPGFTSRAIYYYAASGGPLELMIASSAALGILARVARPFPSAGSDAHWAAIASLVVAVFTFHCIIPCGLEARHLIPALAPSLALTSVAIRFLSERPVTSRIGRALPWLALTMSFWCAFSSPPVVVKGFGEVARMLHKDPGLRRSVFMVSSDDTGEGMFISEMIGLDPRREAIVQRSSKLLAVSRWDGGHVRPLYNTSGEIKEFLHRVPIEVVVIDSTISSLAASQRQHGELVRALRDDPEAWTLIGSYPLTRGGRTHLGALLVYRQRGLDKDSHKALSVDMGEMLKKNLGINLND